MRKIYIVCALLVICQAISPPSLFSHSFSIGMEGGFAPNVLGQKDQFEALSVTNERIERRINDAKNIYGDRAQIKNFKYSGTQLNSVPVGLNIKYIYNKLFFKFSYIYHLTQTDNKSYILNTRAGIDSKLDYGRNLYADLDRNADLDALNDYPLALGLAKTGGKDWLYESKTSAFIEEIPFTFGVVLIGKNLYKVYLGAGVVLFRASTTRTIVVQEMRGDELTEAKGENTRADIDHFRGNAVGFRFMAGAEYNYPNVSAFILSLCLTLERRCLSKIRCKHREVRHPLCSRATTLWIRAVRKSPGRP